MYAYIRTFINVTRSTHISIHSYIHIAGPVPRPSTALRSGEWPNHKIFQSGSSERVPTGNDALHIHKVTVGALRRQVKGRATEETVATEKDKT